MYNNDYNTRGEKRQNFKNFKQHRLLFRFKKMTKNVLFSLIFFFKKK